MRLRSHAGSDILFQFGFLAAWMGSSMAGFTAEVVRPAEPKAVEMAWPIEVGHQCPPLQPLPTSLPAGFDALPARKAALALADHRRSTCHQAHWVLEISDSADVVPPERLAVTVASIRFLQQSCNAIISNGTTTIGVWTRVDLGEYPKHMAASRQETSAKIRLRHLAETIWWTNRIRSRWQGPGAAAKTPFPMVICDGPPNRLLLIGDGALACSQGARSSPVGPWTGRDVTEQAHWLIEHERRSHPAKTLPLNKPDPEALDSLLDPALPVPGLLRGHAAWMAGVAELTSLLPTIESIIATRASAGSSAEPATAKLADPDQTLCRSSYQAVSAESVSSMLRSGADLLRQQTPAEWAAWIAEGRLGESVVRKRLSNRPDLLAPALAARCRTLISNPGSRPAELQRRFRELVALDAGLAKDVARVVPGKDGNHLLSLDAYRLLEGDPAERLVRRDPLLANLDPSVVPWMDTKDILDVLVPPSGAHPEDVPVIADFLDQLATKKLKKADDSKFPFQIPVAELRTLLYLGRDKLPVSIIDRMTPVVLQNAVELPLLAVELAESRPDLAPRLHAALVAALMPKGSRVDQACWAAGLPPPDDLASRIDVALRRAWGGANAVIRAEGMLHMMDTLRTYPDRCLKRAWMRAWDRNLTSATPQERKTIIERLRQRNDGPSELRRHADASIEVSPAPAPR